MITEYKPNQKSGDVFSQVIPIFLKEFFKDDIELVAGAVHLDQSSLHGHVLIKPLCKKCTKPATHRVLNPATKNAQYPASVTEMIRPLLSSERDFISI